MFVIGMKMIKSHVPSLKLCKRMKELGWKQDSIFWYDKTGGLLHPVEGKNNQYCQCAAPLVSEMAEWIIEKDVNLPEWSPFRKYWYLLALTRFLGSMPDAYATQIIKILEADRCVPSQSRLK